MAISRFGGSLCTGASRSMLEGSTPDPSRSRQVARASIARDLSVQPPPLTGFQSGV
jgi:hypothetical protein